LEVVDYFEQGLHCDSVVARHVGCVDDDGDALMVCAHSELTSVTAALAALSSTIDAPAA
jgi:hypothetical protein